MIFLKAGGVLEKGQHFFHISYDFYMEKACESLHINLDIEPYQGDQEDPFYLAAIAEAAKTQIGIEDEAQIAALTLRAMPLRNCISIAVADPLGFRGEDHKMMPNRCIMLAKKGSTPCFSDRENQHGLYKVILHVYSIVSDQCTYTLTVSDGGL